MKNLKKLLAIFNANKSAQFVAIPSYTTDSGRVYENLVINTNISQSNLDKANLTKLLAFKLSDFDFQGETICHDTLKVAYTELIESAKNSLLPKEEKGNRAKGQIDAYIHTDNNAIKIHADSLSVKIMGLKISGTVIAEGEPYDLGKALKTRYKSLIRNQVGFKVKKTYTLEKVNDIKAKGETIHLV